MSDEDQLLEELRAWHTLALKLQSENDQLKVENQELLAWRRAIVKAVEDSNAYIQKQDRELTELRERNAKLEVRIEKLRKPLLFIIENENQAFAECSIAEEIWSRCHKALSEDDKEREL